jgi:phosphoglycerate dehydrogenase-like enzyme
VKITVIWNYSFTPSRDFLLTIMTSDLFMPNVAILSRDANQYHTLLERAALPELKLLWVAQRVNPQQDYAQVDILLADPDLAAIVLPLCTRLRWLQSTWAGNAPLMKLEKRDYQLCGVKGVFGPAMREYVFAYLLHYARNISGFMQGQQNRQWQSPEFTGLAGKTLGIMGVGSIGKVLAKTAKDFAMQVHGLTYSSQDCEHVDRYFHFDQAHLFAQKLDYMVCLFPHTPDTEGMINADFLAQLPPHCVLINAGRGQVIDDKALIHVLTNGKLRAAVLDVFTQEPLPPEHPYWQLENVHITQHSAAISRPKDINTLFCANYLRDLRQQPLNFVLDFARGY